jgi:acyl-CoA thioesterase
MTSHFENDSAIEQVAPGTYKARVHERWWVVRGPHGGYLAAIIARALEHSLGQPDRPIRSFTTHFVAPPDEGPIRIQTSIERAGRSITYMSARVDQDDRLVATSLAAFSGPWKGFEFDDAPAPDVPGPEESIPVPHEGEGIPDFLGNFDMRFNLGNAPFIGADEAVIGGWIRMRDKNVADAATIACYMDAWAPAVFPRSTEPIVAPTIDLTIHFRAPFPLEGATADDFYLGKFSSKLGRDGFFEEDGELWSPNGLLVAQSRQLALAMTR